jgi:2-polyprenyl-3-methyl-5-hydroxy-6-metoxy-1,4-benzoquinol methylase
MNKLEDENKKIQYKVFETLLSIGYLESDTLLDFGCGYGHLINYMTENNISTKNYVGMDTNSLYIETCKKTYPRNHFVIGHSNEINHNFDYIICASCLHKTTQDVYQEIQILLERCLKGIAISFTNTDIQSSTSEKHVEFDALEMFKYISQTYPTYQTRLIKNLLTSNDMFAIFIYKKH